MSENKEEIENFDDNGKRHGQCTYYGNKTYNVGKNRSRTVMTFIHGRTYGL